MKGMCWLREALRPNVDGSGASSLGPLVWVHLCGVDVAVVIEEVGPSGRGGGGDTDLDGRCSSEPKGRRGWGWGMEQRGVGLHSGIPSHKTTHDGALRGL